MKVTKFKLGDVVKLNSGGPRMTVEGIAGNTGESEQKIHTKWFDSAKEMKTGIFMNSLLSLDSEYSPLDNLKNGPNFNYLKDIIVKIVKKELIETLTNSLKSIAPPERGKLGEFRGGFKDNFTS